MSWKTLKRLPYKWHAALCGYFWLPCPLCGEYESGYEWDRTFQKGKHPVKNGRGICEACCDKGLGDPLPPFVHASVGLGGPTEGWRALVDFVFRILFERPTPVNYRHNGLRRSLLCTVIFCASVAVFDGWVLVHDFQRHRPFSAAFQLLLIAFMLALAWAHFRLWRAHVAAKDKPSLPSDEEMNTRWVQIKVKIREIEGNGNTHGTIH